jgi:hypothetical protein
MNTTVQPQANTPVKRRYAKPEIVYQQPLEAMAAACTPIPPGKASGGAPDFCSSLFS